MYLEIFSLFVCGINHVYSAVPPAFTELSSHLLWYSSTIPQFRSTSGDNCEQYSIDRSTPGMMPIVFLTHTCKQHHGYLALGPYQRVVHSYEAIIQTRSLESFKKGHLLKIDSVSFLFIFQTVFYSLWYT